ncbi:MAG: molybdopterin cofactor-binding domain-containing protein, partial [bacterium]
MNLAAKKIKDEKASEDFNPSFADDLRVIGKAKNKVDGTMLAKGQAAYVEDRVKSDSLFVKMLRSPHAHAIITSIDTSEAANIPGVEYILTHENAPETRYSSAGQGFPEPSPYDRRLIDKKVRFVGDRVAAVAATSLEIAQEAISKIKVEYEILKPVLSIEDARKEDAPIIQDYDISKNPLHIGADISKNIAAHNADGIGDADKALQEAEFTIERVYKTSPIQCTPLEPHVVHTHIENDRLIIHASTQVPWHMRRIIASILNIKENKIRVIKEKVGGGFGAKQDIVVEDIASWITWQTGKPVFFRFTREEEFISSRLRHPMEIKIKLGMKKDGTITALDMEVLANTGPYGVHALTVPMNACSKSLSLFKCADVKYSVTAYYTNYPISGAYQGYGAPQGSFAVQMTLAEAAEQLGIDFYELLRKNHVTAGYNLEILKCLGEGQEGIAQTITTCALGEALEKGKELIGLGKKEVSDNPDIKIGKAAVIIQQGSGLPGIDAANAEVKMMGDGNFMLLIGGTDLGTGLDTMAAKMVAECLEVDVE